MSVGLSEENRRTVLSRLTPAFEDLFDQAEEHALNVLLEPWTLFSEQMSESLKRVDIITCTHSLNITPSLKEVTSLCVTGDSETGGALRRDRTLPDAATSLHTRPEKPAAGNTHTQYTRHSVSLFTL